MIVFYNPAAAIPTHALPGLRHADAKVRLLLLTLDKERIDVTVAIPHVYPHHLRRRYSDGLHGPFPHLRLALALHALAIAFSLGRWLAHERLLMRNPQQLSR